MDRRTKIVSTLGPASSDMKVIEGLIEAGVNVFRMNFSHGTHEGHRERIIYAREAARKLGRDVAILQDLQGASEPIIFRQKLHEGIQHYLGVYRGN